MRRATGETQIDFGIVRFQSTLSVRRATLRMGVSGGNRLISIHALREESDLDLAFASAGVDISIHALREESDEYTVDPRQWVGVFQSTLSVRRATINRGRLCLEEIFQSTLSVRRATRIIAACGMRHVISIHALREESDCTDGQHVSHCGTSILRTSSRVAGFEVKTRYSNHSTKK